MVDGNLEGAIESVKGEGGSYQTIAFIMIALLPHFDEVARIGS